MANENQCPDATLKQILLDQVQFARRAEIGDEVKRGANMKIDVKSEAALVDGFVARFTIRVELNLKGYAALSPAEADASNEIFNALAAATGQFEIAAHDRGRFAELPNIATLIYASQVFLSARQTLLGILSDAGYRGLEIPWSFTSNGLKLEDAEGDAKPSRPRAKKKSPTRS